jgi:hypothetical protein
VVEILQEIVHELITLQVERTTVTDPDAYLIQLYVEADVDVHVTPEHSMCEDLLVSCADSHVVCEGSVDEQGGR